MGLVGPRMRVCCQGAEWGKSMRCRIRRASISQQMRDDFERYGRDVIAFALGLGSLTPGSGQFPTHALQTVVLDQADAAAWLTEKRDKDERRETVTLSLEIAIVVLIVVEIILSSVSLYRDFHH